MAEQTVLCNQGGEEVIDCTRSSLVYVGETSRTIYKGSKEQWEDLKSRSEKSHVLKNPQLERTRSL